MIMVGPTRSGKSIVASMLEATSVFAPMFEPITIWNQGMSMSRADDARSPEEATPPVVAAIRDQLEKRLARADAPRFVDDLPHHAFRLGFTRAVLPEARYIVVIRDSACAIPCMRHGWEFRDSLGNVARRRLGNKRYRSFRLSRIPGVAWRWARNNIRARTGRQKISWGPTAPGQREFAADHSLIETIGYQWVQMVEHSLEITASIPQDEVLRIRFEDFWEDHQGIVRKLAVFCGISVEEMAAAADAVFSESKFRGTHTPLSDEEWKRIWPIIGPTQRKLGYPPPCEGID